MGRFLSAPLTAEELMKHYSNGILNAHVKAYKTVKHEALMAEQVANKKHDSHVIAYGVLSGRRRKHNKKDKRVYAYRIHAGAHVLAYYNRPVEDVVEDVEEIVEVQEAPVVSTLKRERPIRVGGSLSIGHFYLFRWTHPNSGHSFLKIGVTAESSPYYRALQQGQYTEYTSECLGFKVLPNKESAYKLESFVKSLFKGKMGVVGKDVFGDGYTETVEDTEANAKRILNIINTDF